MTDIASELERYWEQLSAALPEFSPADQEAAVTLYRELAKGKAVDAEQLASVMGRSDTEIRAILDRPPISVFIYPDDEDRVLGFGGLAAAPTQHRFEIDGRELWTWCAWDSLFLPGILDKTARVASKDPETGEEIRLVVTPHGVDSIEPRTAVCSFPLLDGSQFDASATNVMGSFCHFVLFFASPESGERWAVGHEGTSLYSIKEAFELGRRFNERSFGLELARRRADA